MPITVIARYHGICTFPKRVGAGSTMTIRKSDIKRQDKRIAATAQTLAFLFDISVPTVEKAVHAGGIKPSTSVFGVKLYHVESVEKAVFGLGHPSSDASDEAVDPFLEALKTPHGPSEKKRRDAAA